MAIIGYGLWVLLQPNLFVRIKRTLKQYWVYPFVLLYLWHFLSLLWTEDIATGLFILEKRAVLLGLPVFVALDNYLNKKVVLQSFFYFLLGCCLALIFALVFALREYLLTNDSSVFFYHKLGMPLSEISGIYFSFYLLVGFLLLDKLRTEDAYLFLQEKISRWSILGLVLLGMMLLSSKLFIVLTLCYLLYLYWRNKTNSFAIRLSWIVGFCLLLIGVFSLDFTKKRFIDLTKSQFEQVSQERYNWDTRFSGLTLRLVFLKFGWEILLENDAILTGVGVGDAQNEMNATIKRHNMYHGNPKYGDTGYLGYNFHNQYMELWVELGLIGLVLWIVVLGQGYRIALEHGHRSLIFFLIVITLFAFFESYLERQRGVVLITFFLSAIYTTLRK